MRQGPDAGLATPAGPLAVATAPGGLVCLRWMPGGHVGQPNGPLEARVAWALAIYTEAPDRAMPPLPLVDPGVTAFQGRVWRLMRAIPAGEVRTYGELAAILGTYPRAVGRAAGANPWPLLIPCHRVVARDGLGGYLGRGPAGLAIKRRLLEHEGWPTPTP